MLIEQANSFGAHAWPKMTICGWIHELVLHKEKTKVINMEEVWKNNECHQFRQLYTTNGHLPYAGQRDLLGPYLN